METETTVAFHIEDFGRDHWSLLAFIETQNVDYPNAYTDLNRMRVNSVKRHFGNGSDLRWNDAWGTRNNKNEIPFPSHDDLDVAEELQAAELVENKFTLINPILVLTEKGRTAVNALREHKAKGGSYSNFSLK